MVVSSAREVTARYGAKSRPVKSGFELLCDTLVCAARSSVPLGRVACSSRVVRTANGRDDRRVRVRRPERLARVRAPRHPVVRRRLRLDRRAGARTRPARDRARPPRHRPLRSGAARRRSTDYAPEIARARRRARASTGSRCSATRAAAPTASRSRRAARTRRDRGDRGRARARSARGRQWKDLARSDRQLTWLALHTPAAARVVLAPRRPRRTRRAALALWSAAAEMTGMRPPGAATLGSPRRACAVHPGARRQRRRSGRRLRVAGAAVARSARRDHRSGALLARHRRHAGAARRTRPR